MVSDNKSVVLIFDLHFKLLTKTNEVITFLNQFENSEINQSEFYGKVKFQSITDLLNQNNKVKGYEADLQKELDGMFDEIKLEICRRLRTLLAFKELTGIPKEDWQKLKVFNSILIDLKQQGLFDMVKILMNDYNINLGKRYSLEEKYQPFTPLLNGKTNHNHTKTELKSDHHKIDNNYDVWLNPLEFEKVFKVQHKDKKRIDAHLLPEDLIYEKIIPILIDGNSLNFNVSNEDKFKYRDIFDLQNYHLNR